MGLAKRTNETTSRLDEDALDDKSMALLMGIRRRTHFDEVTDLA